MSKETILSFPKRTVEMMFNIPSKTVGDIPEKEIPLYKNCLERDRSNPLFDKLLMQSQPKLERYIDNNRGQIIEIRKSQTKRFIKTISELSTSDQIDKIEEVLNKMVFRSNDSDEIKRWKWDKLVKRLKNLKGIS